MSHVSQAPAKTALNAGGAAPIFAIRAWVNFQGTGTVSIRSSGNVASVTDLGTGRYRVTFETPMPDANYCAVGGLNGWETTGGHMRHQSGGHLTTRHDFSIGSPYDDISQLEIAYVR